MCGSSLQTSQGLDTVWSLISDSPIERAKLKPEQPSGRPGHNFCQIEIQVYDFLEAGFPKRQTSTPRALLPPQFLQQKHAMVNVLSLESLCWEEIDSRAQLESLLWGWDIYIATVPGFDPCRFLPLSVLDSTPAQHWFGMLKKHSSSVKLADFEVCVVFPMAES